MDHSNFQQPLDVSLLNEVAFPVDAHGNWIAGGPPTLPELGAGGLWTTPTDLARLIIELQKSLAGTTDNILSSASAHLMLTPVKENYGLGVEISTDGGKLSFEHTGSNNGY